MRIIIVLLGMSAQQSWLLPNDSRQLLPCANAVLNCTLGWGALLEDCWALYSKVPRKTIVRTSTDVGIVAQAPPQHHPAPIAVERAF